MNYVTWFFAMLAYLSMLIGLSVLVMIHGWGLEPKSWWWILGVGVCVTLLVRAAGEKISMNRPDQ
jgi:hypothetical protein